METSLNFLKEEIEKSSLIDKILQYLPPEEYANFIKNELLERSLDYPGEFLVTTLAEDINLEQTDSSLFKNLTINFYNILDLFTSNTRQFLLPGEISPSAIDDLLMLVERWRLDAPTLIVDTRWERKVIREIPKDLQEHISVYAVDKGSRSQLIAVSFPQYVGRYSISLTKTFQGTDQILLHICLSNFRGIASKNIY